MECREWYFTYGTWNGYDYKGGWTRVLSPAKPITRSQAIAIFEIFHPKREGNDFVNCADIYAFDEIDSTGMLDSGNCGEYEHELIELGRYGE